MDTSPFTTEDIEQLLRKIPERDAPAMICDHVMTEILTHHRPQSLLERLREWAEKMVYCCPFPIKAGAMMAMVLVAFWFGTEVGKQKHGRETALLPATSLAFSSDSDRYTMGFTADDQLSGLDEWANASLLRPGSSTSDPWISGEPMDSKANRVLFLLNLAHNLADNDNFQGALNQYEKVLQINPQEQTALFYRATSYHHLNDPIRAQQAFIRYLDHYRSGKLALQAVDHLRRLGLFDYQVSLLDGRKIIINQTALLGSHSDARQQELGRIAAHLRRPSTAELHLIVFYQDDIVKSKIIAKELKQQLDALLGTNRAVPIRISWFDDPAPMQTTEGKKLELEKGILLFTQPSTQQRSTI